MVFQASHVAGRAADRATSAGPLQVLTNPLVTALLLTALAMLVFFTFLDGKCLPDVGWRSKTRTAIYLFLGIVAVLGLHFHALERKLAQTMRKSGAESLVNDLHHSQRLPGVLGGSDFVRITPLGQQAPLQERSQAGFAPGPAARPPPPPPPAFAPPPGEFAAQPPPPPPLTLESVSGDVAI